MRLTQCFLAFLVTIAATQASFAQQVKPSRGGFDVTLEARATGEERNNQSNLWVFEVQFKSLRMVSVPTTDAKTGQKVDRAYHYLVYKAINREIVVRKDEADARPINTFDPVPGPEIFVPACMLITTDNGVSKVYKDVIVPAAQAAIERREKLKLLNSVQAMQPVPEAVAEGTLDAKGYFGVAIFSDVDPNADYYTTYLSGFSNGYKLVKGPVAYAELKRMASAKQLRINNEVWNGNPESEWRAAGDFANLFDSLRPMKPGADETQWFYTVRPENADASTIIWRRTILQKYWRPGDRFDQFEAEIRSQGRPIWIYRPDDSKIELPGSKTAAK